jgi:hypothetical protein
MVKVRPEAAGEDPHVVTSIMVTPSLFATLGINLTHGRAFRDAENDAVVISAIGARTLFGGIQAVGRRLVVQDSSGPIVKTVVGVAADTDVGRMFLDRRPLVYMPLTASANRRLILAVRARDATTAQVALRQALARSTPDIPVETIDAATTTLTGPYPVLRAIAIGAGMLGAVTLVVGLSGLYGLQSQLVTLRRSEIGLRLSLGATVRQIRRMVLLDGYRPVWPGLALGLVGGLVARQLIRVYLDIEMSAIDPWAVVLTPLPVLAAAYLACVLPARSAAAIAPNDALRHT